MVEGKKRIRIRSHEYCHEYGILGRELDRIHSAQRVVPQSFLVALVSRYDALLGGIVRNLFRIQPNALKSSDKMLTFAQLAEFDSIERAREHVLERAVETVLRKSHAEQFDWLESKFDIELRTDLAAWPKFIEITERRNLFVHCDGIVSDQYIRNCRGQGVQLDSRVRPGVELKVNDAYFHEAAAIICEIGVKLAQVLWRKAAAKEAEAADKSLSDVTYSLPVEGNFRLAQVLLDFADATLGKRHASEFLRLKFLINRALVYYLAGDKKRCWEILGAQDWSATEDVFKLAVEVLKERFEAAGKLMEKIGPNSFPHKGDYLHWPLFTEFRKRPQFAASLRAVFGDESHDEQPRPAEPTSDNKIN